MNSWGGENGSATVLQQQLNEFMAENPDIVVKNESIWGDDFLPSIKTKFATGNDPDVFGLWPGSDIRYLIANGKVADLTDMLDADPEYKSIFNEKMWQYSTVNGCIYGLPMEIIFEALFYNKDLFDKYGIKVPETYDELVEAVKALKSHGIIPIAYNSEAEGSYLYQNLIMMLGNKDEVEKPFTRSAVNDCYIQAMYKMRELKALGAFPSDYTSLSSEERNNLFINKKAGMIVQGSWFIGNFQNDFTVDLTAFPTLTAEKSGNKRIIYGMGCGIFYVSQKAMNDKNKQQAALKLLHHLASRESASYYAARRGMISNIDISGYSINYNRLTQKGLCYVNSADELIGPPDSFISRALWQSVIIKEFPYMLENDVSPEELWQKVINRGALQSLT
ncbi:carbohydrate ABC transporter substrate-binding protein, CUT1 family [Acetanaerobacterium elongatum]|uniref:Carbohydrate ABC transporter substrate-binding protein, CUT1 family n=2 Tax=Acetanaerobacterium elongatum TaxID=258515 RepID=A0A1G9W9M4_9FIRM|nr:carbohydrate ABC transporter substrate-binding protein, CUT1 family [Acetanaerobacterium elongatum]